MGYSFWDGVGDLFTGGATSVVRYATGKNAIAQADPLHLFTDSESDKLAKRTFDAQQYWNLANYNEQKRQYDENLKFQQEAYGYQKELNAMQMEREDTAVRRRVADLQAAGLSPTLAAGSAANATPVHAANAPQGTPAQMNLPSDIRVQQAMFKEGLMRDQMQLAMSVLGNIADVSRTKAETELIKAQKDRYVAETPIELRLKTLSQEMQEVMNPLTVQLTKLDLDYQELKNVNEKLTSSLMESDIRLKAYDEVIKSWSAYFAPRQEESKTQKLENEVKEKAIAIEMAEFLNKTSKELGVPYEMMSPRFKDFSSWMLLGKKSAEDLKNNPVEIDPELNPVKRWFKGLKNKANWKSPSLLYR